MANSHYHFITNWRVQATVEDVMAILRDPMDLPRWWPSAFLSVAQRSDDRGNVSVAVYDVQTKGWLPIAPRCRFTIVETQEPVGFTIKSSGDMNGVGVWSLIGAGGFVELTFDWAVTPRNPLLRVIARASRPVYSANHRWVMSRGQMSLMRELKLRAAETDAEKAALAPPPGPMPASGALATLGLVLLSVILPGSMLMRVLKHKADKADR